jgi:hypothetical protein
MPTTSRHQKPMVKRQYGRYRHISLFALRRDANTFLFNGQFSDVFFVTVLYFQISVYLYPTALVYLDEDGRF